MLILGVTACPTVDLGDPGVEPGICRPDETYFRDVMWPEYLAPADTTRSCVANGGCHEVATGRSSLRLQATDLDEAAYADNYEVTLRFLNCASWDDSKLLIEPLGGIEDHGGGVIFPDTSDPAVAVFEGWEP
jgi:hypothetical protein